MQTIREELNLELMNIIMDQKSKGEETSKAASSAKFGELGYTIEKEGETGNIRYYIIEGGYRFEIIEDENGRQEVVCIGEDTNGEEPPHTHSYGEYIVEINPTCMNKGQESRICSVCNEKDSRDIEMLEHIYNTEYTIDKEPKCGEEGSKSQHCTTEGCTATTNVTVIEALAHTWEYYNQSDNTLYSSSHPKDPGKYYQKCSTCSKKGSNHNVGSYQATNGTDKSYHMVACAFDNSSSQSCGLYYQKHSNGSTVYSSKSNTQKHYTKCIRCGSLSDDSYKWSNHACIYSDTSNSSCGPGGGTHKCACGATKKSGASSWTVN